MKVFISHSHRDSILAARFQEYLEKITKQRITVGRSSKDGSIEYGNSWIEWIYDQVANAETTFILLTPSSFTAKWVLWEAGAVTGVKRVEEGVDPNSESKHERRVIPIKFMLPADENMGPFTHVQVADGLDASNVYEMGKVFLSMLRAKKAIPDRDIDDAIGELKEDSKVFVSEAQRVFEDLQVFQRQDLVMEWVARLDENLANRNFAFVRSARRWINIAFLGKAQADDTTTPIDFRLHARLAKGFRQLKEWELARDELRLARTLSPRDMLVLRELGRVELDRGNGTKDAQAIINEMKSFDDKILEEDEEALTLEVRILIESNDWPGASKLLQKATELARRSSYVANMRAIATMKVEGAQNAQHYFEQLREFEEKSGSKDFWSLGNQVNAALGLGNTAKADALLEKLSKIPEAYDNRESVARYFDEIINLRKKHDDGFEYNWKAKWK